MSISKVICPSRRRGCRPQCTTERQQTTAAGLS